MRVVSSSTFAELETLTHSNNLIAPTAKAFYTITADADKKGLGYIDV